MQRVSGLQGLTQPHRLRLECRHPLPRNPNNSIAIRSASRSLGLSLEEHVRHLNTYVELPGTC